MAPSAFETADLFGLVDEPGATPATPVNKGGREGAPGGRSSRSPVNKTAAVVNNPARPTASTASMRSAGSGYLPGFGLVPPLRDGSYDKIGNDAAIALSFALREAGHGDVICRADGSICPVRLCRVCNGLVGRPASDKPGPSAADYLAAAQVAGQAEQLLGRDVLDGIRGAEPR